MPCDIFTLLIAPFFFLFVNNYKGVATTHLYEHKENISLGDINSEFWEPDSQLATRMRSRLDPYEKTRKHPFGTTLDDVLNERVIYNRDDSTAADNYYKQESKYNRHQASKPSKNYQNVDHRGPLIKMTNKHIKDHRNHINESINDSKVKDRYHRIDPISNNNNKNRYFDQRSGPMSSKNDSDSYHRETIDPIIDKKYKKNYQQQPTEPISIKRDHDHPTEPPELFTPFRSQQLKSVHTSRNHYSQNRTRHYSSKPEYFILRSKKNRTDLMQKKDKTFRGARVARTGANHHTVEFKSTRVTPMYQMQKEEEENIGEHEHEKGNEENVEDYNEGNKHDHREHNEGKHMSEYYSRFTLNAYSIADQFDKLLSEFPDIEVNSTIVGRTASYVNLLLLKIRKRDSFFRADNSAKFDDNDVTGKKIVFIVHALSPMGLASLYSLTIQNYLKKLLSFYFKHLDKFDIYLMPLGNPDGYIMVKNEFELWNKNCSPQDECLGVDIDRNFDVAWNGSEEISSCSQHYHGPAPFSEPESRAVRDVFHQYSHKLVAYFHVHGGTYDLNTFKGDAVLYPRGYSDSTTDDDRYIDIRGDIDEAMKNANFKTLSVTVDTLHNWYGRVTGTSVDYASTVYGIPYAMELVMQVYQYPPEDDRLKLMTGTEEELEFHALNEIWGRIIDALFTNIHRKLEANENDLGLR